LGGLAVKKLLAAGRSIDKAAGETRDKVKDAAK
jgi:hypothetical protein